VVFVSQLNRPLRSQAVAAATILAPLQKLPVGCPGKEWRVSTSIVSGRASPVPAGKPRPNTSRLNDLFLADLIWRLVIYNRGCSAMRSEEC